MTKIELMESVCKQIWEKIEPNIWEYFHGFNTYDTWCSKVNLDCCDNLPPENDNYSEYLDKYSDINDYLVNGSDCQIVKVYVKDLYDWFLGNYEFYDYDNLLKDIEIAVSNNAVNEICIQLIGARTYSGHKAFYGVAVSTEKYSNGDWFFDQKECFESVENEIVLDSDFIKKWRIAEN